jgi:hypothetical protein
VPANPDAPPQKPASGEPSAPQPQHSTPTSANLVSFRQNPQTAGAQPPVIHPDAPQGPLCDSASLRRKRRPTLPRK